VILHFARSESGYQGSFDSETLRVVEIPLERIEWNPLDVGWKIGGDETTIVFAGQLRADAMTGRFTEGETSGAFSFVRSADAPSARREDITFTSGDVALAGTIFVPPGKGPHPGIVFLHGSGAEGRWASNYLAEKFSQRGFVALTFDKRGVGQSGGNWRIAGFDELAGDAAAAVAALSARPDVDARRVGFHAHSQGATLAPLAAGRIGDPAFIIASAPGRVPMREMEIFSVENALGVRDMSAAHATAAREFVRPLVATAYDGEPRERLMEAWRKVRDKPRLPEPPFPGLGPCAAIPSCSSTGRFEQWGPENSVLVCRGVARVADGFLELSFHFLHEALGLGLGAADRVADGLLDLADD
jgi:acetyl esterase/lipase